MGLLVCDLFSKPKEDPLLEACLVRDSAHIIPGSMGIHVKKIQISLNALSQGRGRENFNLKVDGIYGPKTAAAVKAYKNAASRRILQPFQTTADNIVGKRTIKSLDDEMSILEEEGPGGSDFVSTTKAGSPHDHSKCPTRPRYSGILLDGHSAHHGTPINPKGGVVRGVEDQRKICIFGEGEVDYLGFEDYSTDSNFLRGRPFSLDPPPPRGHGLPDGCASDICLRSAPINAQTQREIRRIARPLAKGGCRFTYAEGNVEIEQNKAFLLGLGTVIEHVVIFQPSDLPDRPGDEPGSNSMQVLVIEIVKF
jgi:hypothetical protein